MSKSYRGAPEWGPRGRKPQYIPTLEEELEDMGRNPQTVYVVISEDQPIGTDVLVSETVALKRTLDGAKEALGIIADGQGVQLHHSDTTFNVDDDPHYEYRSWYITEGILED